MLFFADEQGVKLLFEIVVTRAFVQLIADLHLVDYMAQQTIAKDGGIDVLRRLLCSTKITARKADSGYSTTPTSLLPGSAAQSSRA